MVYGYFDGSQARKTVIENPRSFCGLIGEEDEWAKVDKAWFEILDRPVWPNRPKRFHSYDCVNAVGDFSGWNYTLRHAMFTDLMNVLISSDLLACGVVMLPFAFEALPRHIRMTFGSPELLMMQHAIKTTIFQAEHRWPGVDVGLVFDQGNKRESDQAKWLFDRLPSLPKWGSWTSFSLGDSVKLSMLQAADLMAYGTYRFHKERGFWDGPEPNFRVAPIMERMVGKMPSTGRAWDREWLMDTWVKGANFK